MRNSVDLIGHLGNDVKMMEFSGGSKKAQLSLATSTSYKNAKGELVKDTQWHNLVAWGTLADNMGKLLKKGSQIAVHGSIAYRSYKDADGNDRYITEIKVDNFIVLEKLENGKLPPKLEGAPLEF